MSSDVCQNHRTVQHRDGLPPWCNECGLTAGFRDPKMLMDELKAKLAPEPPGVKAELEQLILDLDKARVHAKSRMTYSEIQERLRAIMRRNET